MFLNVLMLWWGQGIGYDNLQSLRITPALIWSSTVLNVSTKAYSTPQHVDYLLMALALLETFLNNRGKQCRNLWHDARLCL